MIDQYINQIINADCLDIFRQLPDKCVDLVLTDPPYRCISGGNNNNKHPHSCSGILKKNDGKIFKHNDIAFITWIPEVYRILKDNSDFYCMTNVLNLFEINKICNDCGFKLHNILVWEKNNATPNRWYMKNCEYTLFYYKGKAKTIRNANSKTVQKFVLNDDKIHPTEKPESLMRFYIENSSNPNDIVLDCFSGSGTTAVACHNLHRRFICIEKDPEYWAASIDRLEKVQQQQLLF
jgi:site-specific DNA-methyltransferase (adenine-specific)